MEFLSLLSYAQYLPAILEAVQNAVALVEAPGKSGPEKLAEAIPIVRSAIVSILPGNATAAAVDSILALAEPLINAAVAAFNQPGGLFNQKPLPPTPPAPAPIDTAQAKADLAAHIVKMKSRLAIFQAGNAPDKDAHIANLTKNIADAEKALAAM